MAPARVSRPPRASGTSRAPSTTSSVTGQPSASASPAASAPLVGANVAAALTSEADASSAAEVTIDVVLPSTPPEPSSVEIDLDFDAKSEADAPGPQLRDAASKRTRDAGIVPTFDSVAPKRSFINRRVLLVGALGAAALVAILALAFGRHAPAPARTKEGTVASSTAPNVTAAAVVGSANAPSVSASTAVPQSAPEANATAAAQPAASESAAPEDEDVKIAINIKPDGSVLLYKGRVVGRTPFILKQPRGKKRSYEVGKPGYATRRVYLTGTEKSIGFELGLDVPHPDSL